MPKRINHQDTKTQRIAEHLLRVFVTLWLAF